MPEFLGGGVHQAAAHLVDVSGDAQHLRGGDLPYPFARALRHDLGDIKPGGFIESKGQVALVATQKTLYEAADGFWLITKNKPLDLLVHPAIGLGKFRDLIGLETVYGLWQRRGRHLVG